MLNFRKQTKFNFSKITDYLLIGTTPKPSDYEQLKKLGVDLVINMRADSKATSNLIPTLWVPWLDIWYIRISPRILKNAVMQSRQVIASKGKIYVYCKVGRHRSVVMAAAILIAQGYSADKAMQLIKSKRPIADPEPNYIKKSIFNFERWWLDYLGVINRSDV